MGREGGGTYKWGLIIGSLPHGYTEFSRGQKRLTLRFSWIYVVPVVLYTKVKLK